MGDIQIPYFTFKSISDKSLLLESLKTNEKQRKFLESLTQDQSNNVVWQLSRARRLTASNFGRVVRNNSDFSWLVGEHEGQKKTTLPMRWGIMNEQRARDLYAQKHRVVVDKIGFLLSESGILGGTPDGIIKSEKKLIEIKCPFMLSLVKYKGHLMRLIKGGSHWLKMNKHNEIVFNMSHQQGCAYWHQIQGCLYLAGDMASSCDLVVWGPSDWLVLNVKKQDDWYACYGSYLEHFWKVHAAPEICKQKLRMVSVHVLFHSDRVSEQHESDRILANS